MNDTTTYPEHIPHVLHVARVPVEILVERFGILIGDARWIRVSGHVS